MDSGTRLESWASISHSAFVSDTAHIALLSRSSIILAFPQFKMSIPIEDLSTNTSSISSDFDVNKMMLMDVIDREI